MKFTPLDLSSFRGNLENGYYLINYESVSVPIRYQSGRGKSMVIDFHGAINRSRFEIPKFQAIIPDLHDSHQIRIADPTLDLSDTMSIGWYMGGEEMPLQNNLTEALSILFNNLNIERRIYLGGSAGGFAALYYSRNDPESACVAVNPQVDLSTYSRNLVEKYLGAAWPSAQSLDDIDGNVVFDLPRHYGSDFENMVVYLQSTGDIRHFERQLPRFCRIAWRNPKKFILQCSYWGVPDHGNSVPASAYLPWVKALLLAPTLARQDILDSYHTIKSQQASAAVRKPAPTAKALTAGYAPQDLELAQTLQRYHLGATAGGH